MFNALRGLASFWRRQQRTWRVVVTRAIFNRVLNRLTMDYNNIYIRELGASPLQLGSVNGVLGVARMLISIPRG